jgi:diketogulonate reductase-like aldo/keto reductase
MYGTAWKEEQTRDCVLAALAAGFRAIDTANQRKHYFEAAVGEALAEAYESDAVTRDDVFLQTKFTHRRGQDHRLPYDPEAPLSEQVAQSFASSLEHLRVDAIDAYVLHGPTTPFRLGPGDEEVWRAMEQLVDAGKVELLGVSNVTIEQLEQLYALARVKPAFVQNRCFARDGWDREIRAFCRANDVVYQGFSLLTANGRELRRAEVADMAERARATIPQLVFRFALAVGMLPLTGTTSRIHMDEDLACAEIELAEEDVRRLETIGEA